jgi:hypothetical protein
MCFGGHLTNNISFNSHENVENARKIFLHRDVKYGLHCAGFCETQNNHITERHHVEISYTEFHLNR